MKETNQIINNLKQQLKKSKVDGFAESLSLLINSEHSRWIQLLFDNGLIPDPNDQAGNYHKELSVFRSGIEIALQDSKITQDDYRELTGILNASSLVKDKFTNIKLLLAQLADDSTASSSIIYTLVWYLQQVNDAIGDMARSSQGTYDPNMALNPLIPTIGGSHVSPVALYETLCSNVELVLRFLMHSQSIKSLRVPDDPEVSLSKINSYLMLATIWEASESLWMRVRYAGWRPTQQDDEISSYQPRNNKELLIEHAARTRDIKFNFEVMSTFMLGENIRRRHLQLAAETVNLPSRDETWDGAINAKWLRYDDSHSVFFASAIAMVDLRHYDDVMHLLNEGDGANKLLWVDWFRIIRIIRDLAEIMHHKSLPNGQQHTSPEYSSIFRVKTDSLVTICQEVTGLSRVVVYRGLQRLIFNPKNKKLDIWDAPLISTSADECLIVPCLVEGANSRSIIEDFIVHQHGAEYLDRRTSGFERYVGEIMRSCEGAKVVINKEYHASDDKPVEYDVVVWWKDTLILLEAKCLRTVLDVADDYRSWRSVNEAISQLRRRRSLVQTDWESLRAVAPELYLPSSPPESTNIMCIAVTNTFRFTPYVIDGIFVTDDICLSRFFGNPEVTLTSYEGFEERSSTHVGTIRSLGEPSPTLLSEYLRNPKQFSLIFKDVSFETLTIPAVINDQPVRLMVANYNGNNDSVYASLVSLQETEQANL